MWSRLIAFVCALIPFLVNAQVSSVKLTVHVPPVPGNENVFVTGSFNNWKAGDSLYRMKKLSATTYVAVLPVFKNIPYQYKYTLGNWNEVEIALNDSNIRNRSFTSTGNKKKVSDTVMKWGRKPAAQQNTNPQMLKIMAMKDSVLNSLQPRLNDMLQLLKEYTINLLQDNPSNETDKRITADVINHFSDAYGRINNLFHKIFESFTPEQRQKILKSVTAPAAEKDFINALGAAINDAVK